MIYDQKKWQSADQRPKELVFQTIGRFCYIPFYKIHAYSTVGINNSRSYKNKNKKWKELTCNNTHTYTIKMLQNGHHLR